MIATVPSAAERTLAHTMTVLQTRPATSAMRLDYDKRLMLVSGRANPELAAKIASKLGVAVPTCSSSSRPVRTGSSGSAPTMR